MPLTPAPRAAVFAAILTFLPHTAGAQASDPKVRCATAYEQAQRTRKDGALLASREHLLVCAEEACPAILRSECVKWLGEVELATPSVIVVAEDATGAEIVDVTVTIDGARVLERLDGRALPLDPGVHVFRVERASGEVIEQKVLVREGEKRRPVSVRFGASATPAAPIDRPTPSVPTGTWVLGAVGVVGLGAFAAFQISGRSQKSDLDACAPRCHPDEVDSVRRTFVYGDVALGVGVAALAGAAIVWIAQPSAKTSPRVGATVTPTLGGAFGALVAVF